MKTVLILIILGLYAVPVLAETYVWEDDQGTVNYADDLGKVPKEYRKKAKIVGEMEPLPQDTSDDQETSAGKGGPHKSGGKDESAPAAPQGKERSAPPAQTGSQ